jgi:hypothetical protein
MTPEQRIQASEALRTAVWELKAAWIRTSSRRRRARAAHGHFDILDLETALRADVYCLGEDPQGTRAMARRRAVPIADVASMLRISGELLDRRALDGGIARLRLDAEGRKAAATTPTASPGRPAPPWLSP